MINFYEIAILRVLLALCLLSVSRLRVSNIIGGLMFWFFKTATHTLIEFIEEKCTAWTV